MVLFAAVLATLLTAYAVKRGVDQNALRAFVADTAATSYATVWAVLAGGMALSGLVFALLLSLRNTSARAERAAHAERGGASGPRTHLIGGARSLRHD